jgi:signal transduction histidine kinase
VLATEELAGRVWASRCPLWYTDLTPERATSQAREESSPGIVSRGAFPALLDDRVAAVVEFYGDEPEPPDTELIEVLAAIGKQIGQYVERKHAEEQLRRSEEQFRHAQKMEAVGRLAGGVAHDFNNLLTIISGYSDFVLLRTAPDDPMREYVGEIRKAGERAVTLTRQLLAFSRQTVLEPRVLDVNAVVSDVEKMLERLIGEDITLIPVLNPSISRVRVDPGQLEQVLLNLVVNARDAMPQGGTLTIETSNAELTREHCNGRVDVVPGNYVMIAVTDTGCGITGDVLDRIFEPFFTTKGPGTGTGLGLSTVYGIIKQSEGHVGVSSSVGVGTTFRVYLPAVTAGPDVAREPEGGLVGYGTETILLAEDEAEVRRIAKLALEAHGYTVIEAADGQEAIAAAHRHGCPVDLLVTDVVMPHMSGRQLAEVLRERQPGLKVLFMSGYTDDAVVRHGLLHAEVAFLQKPFSPFTLTGKVRELLGETAVSA